MGQAWRAPCATYVRQYVIAGHAVSRLRERIRNTASATYRGEEDLANRIDSAVAAAIESEEFEIIIDDGERTKLVDLTEPLEDSLFAVVKTNKRPGPKEVVVTLLTGDMVEYSRRTSRWTKPLGTLADVMKGDDFANVVKVMPPPRPIVELRTITYYTVDGKGPHCVQYEKALAAEKLAELRADATVRTESIELWKKVSFKTRTVVDMEE